MASAHFRPPTKESFKNKCITSMTMLIIIVSLYVTCYMLFFRTVEVDVTKDAVIEYRGEDGAGTVRVLNRNQNYNQRIQEFMDSITYEVKPSENLKNGDQITIQAEYDETLARRYHIKPVASERVVEVADLPERFNNVNEIPQSFLDTLNERSLSYLDNNMDSILTEDFTAFSIHSQPVLTEQKLMYRVFLDSKNEDEQDRIIDVFEISAKGEVNTSSSKETLKESEATIYYMITYNGVTNSLTVLDEHIYGEKLITKSSVDLNNEKTFMDYMNRKYKSSYDLYQMDISKTE
ncbi:hypothetical protein WKT02_00840 [Erysipelotrichaceae bacterium HCN-30851]